jgi:hypothetical protein
MFGVIFSGLSVSVRLWTLSLKPIPSPRGIQKLTNCMEYSPRNTGKPSRSDGRGNRGYPAQRKTCCQNEFLQYDLANNFTNNPVELRHARGYF